MSQGALQRKAVSQVPDRVVQDPPKRHLWSNAGRLGRTMCMRDSGGILRRIGAKEGAGNISKVNGKVETLPSDRAREGVRIRHGKEKEFHPENPGRSLSKGTSILEAAQWKTDEGPS